MGIGSANRRGSSFDKFRGLLSVLDTTSVVQLSAQTHQAFVQNGFRVSEWGANGGYAMDFSVVGIGSSRSTG